MFVSMPSSYDSWKLASPPEYDTNMCDELECDDSRSRCEDCYLCREHCNCDGQRDEDEYLERADREYQAWKDGE